MKKIRPCYKLMEVKTIYESEILIENMFLLKGVIHLYNLLYNSYRTTNKGIVETFTIHLTFFRGKKFLPEQFTERYLPIIFLSA